MSRNPLKSTAGRILQPQSDLWQPMQLEILNRFSGPNLYSDDRGVRIHISDPQMQQLREAELRLEDVHEINRQFRDLLPQSRRYMLDDILNFEQYTIAIINSLHFHCYFSPSSIQLSTPRSDTLEIIFSCLDIPLAQLISNITTNLLDSIVTNEATKNGAPSNLKDYGPMILHFVNFCETYKLNATLRSLVDAAEKQGIPWFRPDRNMTHIQYGYGVHGQILKGTETNHTGITARHIAHNKSISNQFLRGLGFPVPAQLVVQQEAQLVPAARKIGYPLVVKPISMDRGKGVKTNITSDSDLITAFRSASQYRQPIILEQHLPGQGHRMLVFEGKLLACSKGIEASVIADGKSTIRDLVDRLNEDPRRGWGNENLMVKVPCDENLERILTLQGLALDAIPEVGLEVQVTQLANISAGATALDLTEQTHPDNKALAERAARTTRLAVTGIDFVTPDISKSWQEMGGIIEMNVMAGIRPHLIAPPKKPVQDAIFERLFEGGTGRIPTIAITGTSGKTTTCIMLGEILRKAGHCVGVTTTMGVYIDGHCIKKADLAGPAGSSMLLRDPSVTAAVLETSRGGLVKYGLGVPSVDIGVVLNVRDDHIGMDGIATKDDMAQVKSLVAKNATNAVVLNKNDKRCCEMAATTQANQIVWVGTTDDLTGSEYYVNYSMESHELRFYQSGELIWQYNLLNMPAYFSGAATHNGENASYAAAVALTMNIDFDVISSALSEFEASIEKLPGRGNRIDGLPFPVLIDYAHNRDKMRSLAKMAQELDVKGRRVLIIYSQGDRSEEHFSALARMAAPSFDYFVCSFPDKPRGINPDEVQRLLINGLLEAGVQENQILVSKSASAAVSEALSICQKEDFLFITASDAGRVWQQIKDYKDKLGKEIEESIVVDTA